MLKYCSLIFFVLESIFCSAQFFSPTQLSYWPDNFQVIRHIENNESDFVQNFASTYWNKNQQKFTSVLIEELCYKPLLKKPYRYISVKACLRFSPGIWNHILGDMDATTMAHLLDSVCVKLPEQYRINLKYDKGARLLKRVEGPHSSKNRWIYDSLGVNYSQTENTNTIQLSSLKKPNKPDKTEIVRGNFKLTYNEQGNLLWFEEARSSTEGGYTDEHSFRNFSHMQYDQKGRILSKRDSTSDGFVDVQHYNYNDKMLRNEDQVTYQILSAPFIKHWLQKSGSKTITTRTGPKNEVFHLITNNQLEVVGLIDPTNHYNVFFDAGKDSIGDFQQKVIIKTLPDSTDSSIYNPNSARGEIYVNGGCESGFIYAQPRGTAEVEHVTFKSRSPSHKGSWEKITLENFDCRGNWWAPGHRIAGLQATESPYDSFVLIGPDGLVHYYVTQKLIYVISYSSVSN